MSLFFLNFCTVLKCNAGWLTVDPSVFIGKAFIGVIILKNG